jgi:hypothetical protein
MRRLRVRRLLCLAGFLAVVCAGYAGVALSTDLSRSGFGDGGWCKGDPVRDSGTAPDITAVCVGSGSDGTIELRVRTRAPISNKDQLMFSVDADFNRHTGGTAGFDYWLGSEEGHMVILQVKPTKQLHLRSFHGFVRSHDLILILNRRDLGNTTRFRFYAWSQRGQIYGDDAPDGAALLTYTLPRQ